MITVHPVLGKFFSCDCFCLGDLILVMWENIIDPAEMKVNLLSEESHITRTTFYMPSRPS